MKLLTKKEIIPLVIIFFLFVFAVGFYRAPCLPQKIPSHWNSQGEIDAYSSKNFFLFFYPSLTLAIYLLMLFLPLIDPLRKNYHKFARPYYLIRLSLIVFLAGLYFYSILSAFSSKIPINRFIIPFLSLLFAVIGLMMPKIKKNYFVGVRTPWTLQSEEVWQKTHQFAGKTMTASALLAFFTIFLGKSAFGIFITLVLVGALLPIAYSYYIYRKLGLFNKKLEKQ